MCVHVCVCVRTRVFATTFAATAFAATCRECTHGLSTRMCAYMCAHVNASTHEAKT
jgi:hypothetical protein